MAGKSAAQVGNKMGASQEQAGGLVSQKCVGVSQEQEGSKLSMNPTKP